MSSGGGRAASNDVLPSHLQQNLVDNLDELADTALLIVAPPAFIDPDTLHPTDRPPVKRSGQIPFDATSTNTR